MSKKEINMRYFIFSASQWKSKFGTLFKSLLQNIQIRIWYLFWPLGRQVKVDIWYLYLGVSVNKFNSKFITFFQSFCQQICTFIYSSVKKWKSELAVGAFFWVCRRSFFQSKYISFYILETCLLMFCAIKFGFF